MGIETIYTPMELSSMLKMSKSKVYALIQSGQIPHIKVGKSVRVTESQLKAWLEAQTINANDISDVWYFPKL